MAIIGYLCWRAYNIVKRKHQRDYLLPALFEALAREAATLAPGTRRALRNARVA